jgi:trans-2,3-dihydro-3-hydroxyanthranilate isomerase
VEHTFYLVDVFAEGRYSGNQLAVFRNASLLSVEDMRHLAREVHFSETAFVLSDEPRDGGFDLRVFTPLEEIPFSGHAVLGAAWVLQRELIHRPVDSIRFNLGAGSVQADLVYRYGGIDTVWVNHLPPQFLACPSLDSVAAAIGLDVSEIEHTVAGAESPPAVLRNGAPAFSSIGEAGESRGRRPLGADGVDCNQGALPLRLRDI